MVKQILTAFGTRTRDNVDDAVWYHVAQKLHENKDAKRRTRRSFEHGTIARSKHGCELPRCHEEGEVPWHDLAHHANGLTGNDAQKIAIENPVCPLFGQNSASEQAKMLGCKRDIDIERLADGLAVIKRLDGSQKLFILVDDVRDFHKDGRALGAGNIFPRIKSSPGCFYGSIDIFFCSCGNVGKHLACRRVLCIKCCTIGGGNEAAVNVEAVVVFELYVHIHSFYSRGLYSKRFCVKRLVVHGVKLRAWVRAVKLRAVAPGLES